MVTREIKIKVPDDECCDNCNYIKYIDPVTAFCNIFLQSLEKDEDTDAFLPCDSCLKS